MGNDSSTPITLDLDRQNSFYFAGETISGALGFNITVGNVKVDEVSIRLTGEICYTTVRRVITTRGGTREKTQYHNVPFHSSGITLARPKVGQKRLVYRQGQYSWPFQFQLPNYLPPTLNKLQLYPCVRYCLRVVIDKPWYASTIKRRRYVTIYPRVNLLQNPECLSSFIFGDHNRKHITLKRTLNKTGYVPEELIHITLEIENPQRVLIKYIDLSMLQSYRIGQNSCGYTILRTTLPNITDSKDEHIKQKYSVKMPSTTSPSYNFIGGLDNVVFVNNHYMIRFAVKVRGIHADFHVDIPITLGTEPNPDLNQQHIYNPILHKKFATADLLLNELVSIILVKSRNQGEIHSMFRFLTIANY